MGGLARVGAVDPPASRGFLELFPPSRLLPPRPFPSPFLAPPAAIWAAFLFLRSMAMVWPGKTWARAHLWPNLQLPFTNHAQTSF
jgi:hypothetical protein